MPLTTNRVCACHHEFWHMETLHSPRERGFESHCKRGPRSNNALLESQLALVAATRHSKRSTQPELTTQMHAWQQLQAVTATANGSGILAAKKSRLPSGAGGSGTATRGFGQQHAHTDIDLECNVVSEMNARTRHARLQMIHNFRGEVVSPSRPMFTVTELAESGRAEEVFTWRWLRRRSRC